MKSYYVYIGQSFHFGEKTAYTVGFSTNLTRRCYTKHMHLLNVLAFRIFHEILDPKYRLWTQLELRPMHMFEP